MHGALPDCDFSVFRVLAVDDVIIVTCKIPDKQRATDPLPTHLLKDNAVVLAKTSVENSAGRRHAS